MGKTHTPCIFVSTYISTNNRVFLKEHYVVEAPGIDPGTSRTPCPQFLLSLQLVVSVITMLRGLLDWYPSGSKL